MAATMTATPSAKSANAQRSSFMPQPPPVFFNYAAAGPLPVRRTATAYLRLEEVIVGQFLVDFEFKLSPDHALGPGLLALDDLGEEGIGGLRRNDFVPGGELGLQHRIRASGAP